MLTVSTTLPRQENDEILFYIELFDKSCIDSDLSVVLLD